MIMRKSVVFTMLLLCSALLASAATVPAGTKVTVRMGAELSSGTAKIGDTWKGTLAKDVVVDGNTVAKTGDEVTGKVTNVKSSGRLHAPGQLSLRLTSRSQQPLCPPGEEPYQEQCHQDRRRRGGWSSDRRDCRRRQRRSHRHTGRRRGRHWSSCLHGKRRSSDSSRNPDDFHHHRRNGVSYAQEEVVVCEFEIAGGHQYASRELFRNSRFIQNFFRRLSSYGQPSRATGGLD